MQPSDTDPPAYFASVRAPSAAFEKGPSDRQLRGHPPVPIRYGRSWPLADLPRLALAKRKEERVTPADDPFSFQWRALTPTSRHGSPRTVESGLVPTLTGSLRSAGWFGPDIRTSHSSLSPRLFMLQGTEAVGTRWLQSRHCHRPHASLAGQSPMFKPGLTRINLVRLHD